MSVTMILQYLLLLLLGLFTIINIYSLTAGKKKRQKAQNGYQHALVQCEQRALNIVERENLAFTTKVGYLTDQGEAILLTFDEEHQMVGIFLSDEYHTISRDEFISAKKTHQEGDKNRINTIASEIETKTDILTITFGNGEYKRSSYLGKFILKDCEDFCGRIINHLRP